MTDNEAFQLIIRAIKIAVPAAPIDILPATHLIKDGVIDSLDLMAFLFELEQLCGGELAEIDENFSDFTVGRLIQIVALRA